MTDYGNETLEETQKRLASQARTLDSPWVNHPSTEASPPAVALPPAYTGTAPPPSAHPATTAPAGGANGRRRGIGIAVVALGTLVVLGVAIAVAVSAIRPPIDPIWADYPGNAFVDPAEVLANDSKEEVVADAEAFLAAYRDELTAELGMEWSESWQGSLEYGSNYYDGESLLWSYNSGEWQGSVRLSEPGARERVAQVFERLSGEFGASDYRFNNELYADDPEQSEEQFGAADVDDQGVWSFTGSGDESRSQFRIVSRVWDRSLPTGDGFTGEVWFDTDSLGQDMLVVTVSLWSDDLLSESDRETFIERLVPYEDLERPDPE